MNHFKPLDFDSGPLVWIDCEMTGLNPSKDKILEVAVLITNGKLELVDPGIEFVVQTDKASLDQMDEWCTKQHGSTGLTESCLQSPHTRDFVAQEVLSYVKKWIPKQRVGMLAGSSVHVDKLFLMNEMPEMIDWLHYRIVVSRSVQANYAGDGTQGPIHQKHCSVEITGWSLVSSLTPEESSLSTTTSPRALDDIKGSIRELQWYRDNIFKPPSPSRR
ncbi:hypothetical protein NLI96_g5919 [Meripilus lineatus]|uniref:Exonuclease domain-containing protein n=1 Tax=Meripilus lineatus TaxID=2056292 RepID=A0AAD5V1Y6_9APHY|nr:hypothetical protein NLI96_g5919 [Physisporinus lineatus]